MSFEMLASPFITIQGNKSSIPLELHHDQDPPDFLFGTAGILPSPPPSSLAPAKRKRRRRPKICKNQEEIENQRMTHIAVERNRRRQMNEHLSVLRSLMPDSYMQRGDQASIVGGAIEFVKELEHLLQSLEAHKRRTQREQESINAGNTEAEQPPFAQFFVFPQYSWRQARRDFAARPAAADIEVSLIETHASLRILSPRRPRQLVQLVAGLQLLRLSVLHLNLTTVDAMVLYSLSLKVDEGCSLTTVDDIAAAVHHLLSLIDAETTSAVPD